MTKKTPDRWDRHIIKAEVHRRGSTLRAIALAAGLDPSACSAAMSRRHIAGEQALARFLGVAPEVLWPERYRCPSPWAKNSLRRWREASQIDSPPADRRAAA